MRVEENHSLYKDIAETYLNDSKNIYAESRGIWIEQIKKHLPRKIDQILDLCIGGGESLKLIDKHFDVGSFHGNDISKEMLDLAEKLNLPFIRHQSNAEKIDEIIEHKSQSIVLCHYLLSYCSANKLFEASKNVLVDGGYLSISTTIWDDNIELQKKVRWIDESYCRKNYHSSVVSSKEMFYQFVYDQGFNIIEEKFVKKDIVFHTYSELINFAYYDGWLVSFFQKNRRLKLWICAIIGYLMKYKRNFYPLTLKFPFCVLLLKKRE